MRGNVDLSLIIQTKTDEPFKSLLITPDQRHLLTISDSIPRLWDIATGCLLREFTGHPLRERITAKISADGELLATHAGNEVRLWNLRTGELLETKEWDPTGPRFIENGGQHYLFALDGLRRWEPGREVPPLLYGKPADDREPGSTSTFSPDEKTVAFGYWSGAISLHEVASGKLVRRITGHGDRIASLKFSADGKRLLSASGDRTVRLWDVADGRELLLLAGHFAAVADARFAATEDKILTASADGSVRTWDAASGAELLRRRFPIVKDQEPLVAWLDDDHLVVASWINCARRSGGRLRYQAF